METQTPEVKKTIFSGIQPSGSLTIGNYIGALRNFTLLQDDYNCIYCVVDMHAITVRQDPAQLRRRCLEVAATYIACGLDPKKNIIYCQSHVSGHAELAWILNCFTYMGELSRMTQYKDKCAKHADNINAGLFDLPRADGGGYSALSGRSGAHRSRPEAASGADPEHRPAFQQHLRRRFHRARGLLRQGGQPDHEPAGPHPQDEQVRPGRLLTSPFWTPSDAIRRKIKRAVTDSDGEIRYDPENKPGVSNLLSIIAAMSNQDIDSVVSDLQGQGYGALKNRCTEVVLDTLRPIQAEHARLMADKGYLQSILDENAQRANYLAQKTLRKIQKKVGFAAR